MKWLKTDLRRKHRVDVKIAGVVFKPEDSKEGMVDSLMAKSTRSKKQSERAFLSYLNPLSYIVKEIPMEDEDRRVQWPVRALSMYFGVPLFAKDTVDDVPDCTGRQIQRSSSGQSGGFFDTESLQTLNP